MQFSKYILTFYSILVFIHGDSIGKELSNHPNAKTKIMPVETKAHEVGSLQWVMALMKKYPELSWLADRDVRRTHEWQDEDSGKAWSEQLFGEKFIEFERTTASIRNMYLILDGSREAYDLFTSVQKEDEKLSFEQFQEVHKLGVKLINTDRDMLKAMEIALIISDQGKSKEARKRAQEQLNITAEDHDVFYSEVIAADPSFFPSFRSASSNVQKLIKRFPHTVHFGHVYHLEGGTNMFTKLKESDILKADPIAFECEVFLHICDVSAAAAHVNNKGSMVYLSNTHNTMMVTEKALKLLTYRSEKDALDFYIARRAEWLGYCDTCKHDRALTRFAAMLRLFDKESGQKLKKAFLSLSEKEHVKIINAFDPDKVDPNRPTPTYVPAVLVNLFNNKDIAASEEDRYAKVVALGGGFVARALESLHSQPSKDDQKMVICFNEIAGVAKSDPEMLATANPEIQSDGMVIVVSTRESA